MLIASSVLSACTTVGDDGSAKVGVGISALSAADVSRVVVSVTGPGISEPISTDLVRSGEGWQGVIGKIPTGTDRVFAAHAYSGTELVYSGTASTVTIAPGVAAMVYLVLQQETAPKPFTNAAPVIDSLIASRNAVAPSDTIDLAVVAHDPNPGDVLSTRWLATAGTFNDWTSNNPTWTAPSSEGVATLTVQVTDPKAATQSLSFTVDVSNGNAVGRADVSATVNTWPVVSSLTASPAQLSAGQSTALNLQVSDADNDTLSIAWSDGGGGCTGVFSSQSALAPTWTAPASLDGISACTLKAEITDGRGGSTTAALTVAMGAGAGANIAPVVTNTFQSSGSVAPNGGVYLKVTAADPEGQALSFSWSATSGTLASPTTTTTTSEVTWTAPSTGCDHSITVAVSDPGGGVTHETFTVNTCSASATGPQLGGCPMLPVDHVFNTPIDSLPAHASSDAFIASIGSTQRLRVDLGTQTDPQAADYYGIPYNLVNGTAFTWPSVSYETAAGYAFPDESDCADVNHNVLSPCTAAQAHLPLGADMKVEGGNQLTAGDHRLLVVDTASCRLWEVYDAYSPQSGTWNIASSAMFDLRSNTLRPDGWMSADAGGLPILPLLLRADEASTGEIKHALRLSIPGGSIRSSHVWPARHDISTGGPSTSLPPMGQLFRLKASYVIPSSHTTQARAILQALKTYGVYIADGGSMSLSGEPSAAWETSTISQVTALTAADFEAVDIDAITSRAGFDPDSGAVPSP